ncbi:MAG: hypothetical protein KF871_06015 [Hydrogenophaga sp.]|uniref:hypothetical protein n=1 Tax=Hydrogenophaga sp. TaxID=1904254 RepID=UPI001D8F51FE|nr:hypothetical protein [Hydrogenophaga sp.]MBX3609435.1 hypothetical protein [Hydrogenophaga sp.]
MQGQSRRHPVAAWWCVLCLFWPMGAAAQDACSGLVARGIYCTLTPNDVGPWAYYASYGNWTADLARDHPSAESLLAAWAQATRQALNAPTLQCDDGTISADATQNTTSGRFTASGFPDSLQVGSYRNELHCTDTSTGQPAARTVQAVIAVAATRTVGCAAPLQERTDAATNTPMCVGDSQPVVTLRDLGAEQSGTPGSPRRIEAAVRNAANHNAPMPDTVVTLQVLPPAGQLPAGRLLNTSYPGQYLPATQMRGITDSNGLTVSTFYWPQTSQQAPVQRIGANCDAAGVCAAVLDLHWQTEIVVGFFNGVGNTDAAAQKSLKRLEDEFGQRFQYAFLKFDWFYNQTACGDAWYGKVSCLEDVAEVFDQRSQELGGVFANRWEVFWDILAGRHADDASGTGQLLGLLGDGGNALLQWLDATANALINQLARDTLKLITLFSDSPTYENRADHLQRLQQHADQNRALLLVAHSQGNLFVNSAFDALRALRPQVPMQVVHVAPASPTLRGAHLLADIDLVINGLRLSGINSVPDANVNLPLSRKDVSGHGFEPTYLDKTRAAYARTIGMINASLAALAP